MTEVGGSRDLLGPGRGEKANTGRAPEPGSSLANFKSGRPPADEAFHLLEKQDVLRLVFLARRGVAGPRYRTVARIGVVGLAPRLPGRAAWVVGRWGGGRRGAGGGGGVGAWPFFGKAWSGGISMRLGRVVCLGSSGVDSSGNKDARGGSVTRRGPWLAIVGFGQGGGPASGAGATATDREAASRAGLGTVFGWVEIRGSEAWAERDGIRPTDRQERLSFRELPTFLPLLWYFRCDGPASALWLTLPWPRP